MEDKIAGFGTTLLLATLGAALAGAPQSVAKPTDPADGTKKNTASMKRADIQRVMDDVAHDKIRACYNERLRVNPKLVGLVETRFYIGPSGAVEYVELTQQSTLHDKPLRECISKTIAALKFPPPTGDGRVAVSYPYSFDGVEERQGVPCLFWHIYNWFAGD